MSCMGGCGGRTSSSKVQPKARDTQKASVNTRAAYMPTYGAPKVRVSFGSKKTR